MTTPNPNTQWARTIVDELVAHGVTDACIAPGSRSTPLTLAFARHPDVEIFSLLDERSAGFFALGRAKHRGMPTPLVCTSGTATANLHPAVIEANQARVPMLVLTADRPPELQDSGANQTIEQSGLYGDAVRWERTLPEAGDDGRKHRMLRTTAARAIRESTGTPPGPVHLNVPFRKPLEPTAADETDSADTDHAKARTDEGSDTPDVSWHDGPVTLEEGALDDLLTAVRDADRGLIVAGPVNPHETPRTAIARLSATTGFPILADPLSGLRFGSHTADVTVLGGYDGYLEPGVTSDLRPPDVVLRFGASPTSKRLRQYLERTRPRQFLIDPAGGWREATFTGTDLLETDPAWVATAVADAVDRNPTAWHGRFVDLEAAYWGLVAATDDWHEGDVLRVAVEGAPDGSALFVSNSSPVRDLDRFVPPAQASLTAAGNRGASGIDGITSSALGLGSASERPLVLVTGDLAYYHDMNGLLAIARCDVDVTAIVVNNDGGGIFHRLPIAEHDAFEEHFVTPHGLDFEPTGELYDLNFRRVDGVADLESAYLETFEREGSHVIEVPTDAAASQAVREALQERVRVELP